MFKSLCFVFICLFSITSSNFIHVSNIILDPVGQDVNHPVLSNCLPSDDFSRDPNDDTKFYRCADGVQNSMHCAPGTIFEGMLYEDKLIIMKNQCGFKSGKIQVEVMVKEPKSEYKELW